MHTPVTVCDYFDTDGTPYTHTHTLQVCTHIHTHTHTQYRYVLTHTHTHTLQVCTQTHRFIHTHIHMLHVCAQTLQVYWSPRTERHKVCVTSLCVCVCVCLQRHYHPVVRQLAVHLRQGAPSEGSAALSVDLSRRYEPLKEQSTHFLFQQNLKGL